jgi:hypothetical protein
MKHFARSYVPNEEISFMTEQDVERVTASHDDRLQRLERHSEYLRRILILTFAVIGLLLGTVFYLGMVCFDLRSRSFGEGGPGAWASLLVIAGISSGAAAGLAFATLYNSEDLWLKRMQEDAKRGFPKSRQIQSATGEHDE